MGDSNTGVERPRVEAGWRLHPQFLWCLAIPAAVFVAYLGARHSPLVSDDLVGIGGNPAIRHLSGFDWLRRPPPSAGLSWRPLPSLCFALCHALGRLDPEPYHLVNFGIHALSAVILFGVVRRTLGMPGLRTRFGGEAPAIAGAIALLWAVHPLPSAAVIWISQLTELLMGFFYFLALYCFIRGVGGRAGLWHPLAIAAGVLSGMSKESAATLPVVILLYDRSFVAGTFRAALRARWRTHLGLFATWLPLALFVTGLGSRGIGVGFGLGVSGFTYALTECRAVLAYLSLCAWPHPLVFDRGLSFITTVAESLPYAVPLALLLGVTGWALVRRPALGFLGAWFFIILAPTSSFVPVSQMPAAENRVYLPLAGMLALGVIALRLAAGLRATCAACVVLAAAGLLATASRCQDYRSAISLWTDTIRKNPGNPRAQSTLGALLAQEPGREEEAIARYETALRLKPDYAMVHYDLASLLAGMPGREAGAEEHFLEALRLKPDYAIAHNNLALLLEREPGRAAEAISHYEAALRAEPDRAEVHANLAALLAGRPGGGVEAREHFEAALRLAPDAYSIHYNFGNFLFADAATLAEAAAQYEIALRLRPDFAQGHFNAAVALAKLGRIDEAVGHLRRALEIQPDLKPARDALDRLLAPNP